jgi:hypothetical protein
VNARREEPVVNEISDENCFMMIPVKGEDKIIKIDLRGFDDSQIAFFENIRGLFESYEVYKRLSTTNNLSARPFEPLGGFAPEKKGFGL